MENKDRFSDQSKLYAAFRPTYPETLYSFIFQHLKAKDTAWDCATGNGQVARRLAREFTSVYASDISEKQLKYAHSEPNIFYSLQKAEGTTFTESAFDLITVGQALHWFDLEKFYKETSRVGKSDGVLAVWGYGNIVIRPEVDKIINHFYTHVVGKFWEPARRMVEDHYAHVDFPFLEIKAPEFFIEAEWSINHLIGYIESWSATQAFIRVNNENPLNELGSELEKIVSNDEKFTVRFPVFLKLGRIKK